MHWLALHSAPNAQAPPSAVALADPHTALAWWMLRFTPLVARVQSPPMPNQEARSALVLEVSGSERLFGGRAALLAQIFMPNMPAAPVQYAQGATSLIALGRLWSTPPQPGASALPDPPVDSLPVHSLQAAQPHLPTLARLGVRTWGQLRALPRGGVARRFGAELLDALDRAYGLRPEVYPWLTLPEVFDAPLELSVSVDSAPALLFGARRLLAQLLVWLRVRQRGVLALELRWDLDARRSNTLHVDAHHTGGQQGRLELRTAQATQDITHLQRLLGEQLARVTLPAPVLYLRLRTLQTQPLAGESHSLLPDDLRTGDSLHHTLERLAARLGAQQVQCVQPQADHRPEHMQRWQPWTTEPSVRATKNLPDDALYPTWLLPTAQRLQVHQQVPHYQGPLTLLAGPQRLEAGWLEGEAALRDYYVARSPVAGLVWIYCERLGVQQGPDWYLHGLFA
jgi:protein ImuB